MRNVISLLALAGLAALFTSGCAGPEQKLGRGISNTFEITRMGDMRRSIEQTAVFESPSAGYTVGAIRGLDRTLARTGVGIFEVFTFPLPMPDRIRPDFPALPPAGARLSRQLQTGPDCGFDV